MTSLLAILTLGFVLGMRHATDPDHVIAVTTIASHQRSVKGAALIGAVWGLGHTLTIMLVGGGIILFRWVIPGRVGLSMEFAVGLMLIVLGAANLRDFARLLRRGAPVAPSAAGHDHGHQHDHAPVHSHAHVHGDYVHTHPHGHAPEAHPHGSDQTPLARLDRFFGRLALYRLARPLVVGVVHGLAGSAAVALLVLTTVENPEWSVFYLLLFGVGTIIGMMLITMAITSPLLYSGRLSERFTSGLRIASGLVSVVFGCWIAYRIGIVEGLFTANPHWTPE
jgi:ABC-type nickel/cobalt efflux system permease component RcnA